MGAEYESIFEHREPIRKPGWRKALPWVLVVLVVGLVIAVVSIRYSNTGHSPATALTNKPAVDVSKIPATVKLPHGATRVARLFIETAVARKNLGQSYSIVTDEIKQGQSLRSWMTGNIAVVPFPVVDVKYAPMKIDFSYPAEAQIEVALLPKNGTKVHGQLFIMDIVKRHGKWLVNSWVPRASAPVPNGSSNNGAGN